MPTSVMWFRRDLRLGDNPALLEAGADGDVLPLFVLDPALWGPAGPVPPGLPRRLAASPRRPARRAGSRWSAATRCAGWCWPPRRSGPSARARRGRLRPLRPPSATSRSSRRWPRPGVELVRTGSPYAVAPGRVTNGSGDPYKVFTPFSRAWSEHGWRDPVDPPTGVTWLELDERRRGTTDIPDPALPAGLDAARGRRGGRDPAVGGVPRPGRPLRRRPRQARRRRHLAHVGAPQVGRDPPAHDARRAGPQAQQRRGDLPQGAGLARVLRRRAVRAAADRARLPPRGVRADGLRPARARSSRRGRRGGPASRSWTPGCASSAPPAGCTTGCG